MLRIYLILSEIRTWSCYTKIQAATPANGGVSYFRNCTVTLLFYLSRFLSTASLLAKGVFYLIHLHRLMQSILRSTYVHFLRFTSTTIVINKHSFAPAHRRSEYKLFARGSGTRRWKFQFSKRPVLRFSMRAPNFIIYLRRNDSLRHTAKSREFLF